jgi:hypothetical protein
MKLLGWTKNDSSEDYRLYLQQEYRRLQSQAPEERVVGGFEEVKLRLFLSLLDNPDREEGAPAKRAVND